MAEWSFPEDLGRVELQWSEWREAAPRPGDDEDWAEATLTAIDHGPDGDQATVLGTWNAFAMIPRAVANQAGRATTDDYVISLATATAARRGEKILMDSLNLNLAQVVFTHEV